MEKPTTLNGMIIDTDFRAWINFELLLQDLRLTDEARLMCIIKILFPVPPRLTEDMLPILHYFYLGGRTLTLDEEVEEDGDAPGGKLYCFREDKARIKAAYMAEFGFDPWALDYLHWWDFRACFFHLLGDQFKSVISIRSTDLSKLTGKNRIDMERLQKRHRLKTADDLTIDKYNQDAAEAYKAGNLADFIRRLNQ